MTTMIEGIRAINRRVQPVTPPTIKLKKSRLVMDRIWRINARMSRGKGITLERVMELEGICAATGLLDLKWLLDNGFVKYEMIASKRGLKRLNTRLYTAVNKC